MSRIKCLGLIIALCLLATACNIPASTSHSEPVGNYVEPTTQEEPAPQVPISAEPTEPAILLPALYYIIASGRFEGSHINFMNEVVEYSTYINTALGIIYHFDREAEGEDGSLFFAVSSPSPTLPGGLMQAHAFQEIFSMSVMYGSGEEWVRAQADSYIERFVHEYREWHEYMKENLGEERLEQYLADRTQSTIMLSFFGFGSHNYEDMEFWPIEYIAAGRIFRGLQINIASPWSGFNNGFTFLYTQICDDVAIVIAIDSEDLAENSANQHMNRIDVFL